MPQKLIISCTYEGERRPSAQWGSVLHGALMQRLPRDTAETLHESALRPFSQYVLPKTEKMFEWHVGLLDEVTAQELRGALLSTSELTLAHKGLTVLLEPAGERQESERELFERFFIKQATCRSYTLEFLSPCTHKSEGGYVCFPSAELIVQNLYNRYRAFAREIIMEDTDAVDELSRNVSIRGYRLRSAGFSVDGHTVTGYMGSLTLGIRGPDQLARLAGMLLGYAEYAGVGIKTSLGMGGCRVSPVRKRVYDRGEEQE